MRVAVAGAGRRKAPSASQQVVLTACASEKLRRGSVRALLPNWAHCCRGCLLTLTANNVLLDDCALLKPERSQRLMKGSRKWRRMRATDADAGPCPRRGKLPKEDYAHIRKSAGICVVLFPFHWLSAHRRETTLGEGEMLPLCLGRAQFQSSWQSLVSGGCILLMLGKLLNERDA